MSIVSWRCVFYFVVFSFVVIFFNIRADAILEGSSMGYLSLPYSQQSVVFPRVIRVSDVKVSDEGHAINSRRKRNILFQSGVKLCAQDTAQQVVATHLNYFHLRVCQETIWEAFKIFWDRLPEQEEYQSWMSQCQEGTVTAQYIGSYFSQSEEHQALVKKRMSLPGLKSEPTRSWQHICSSPTPTAPESVEAPELEDKANGEVEKAATIVPEVEESLLDNDIAVQPSTPTVLEQVVELSILLTGETFSDNLNDPASLQHQTLSRQLAEKIEDALEGLPGFKSVSVLDFRPQKDTEGLDGVVAEFAVTVVVEGEGVSTEQLDYLTLQSNRVENSYREVMELPTVVYTISEVKNVITVALHNNELESVSEVPESVNAADVAAINAVDEPPEVLILEEDTENVNKDDVLPVPSETNTVTNTENDVVVLEEIAVVSPAPVLTTRSPEAGGIEEEGLLLWNTVQTPVVKKKPPAELPAELPSPELPEGVTLSEPPVEIEASGSGTDDLEVLIQPSISTEEEKEVSLEETGSEDGLTTQDVTINAGAISEAETEEVEVAAVGEEPTTAPLEEEHLDEVVVNEAEIPEGLEFSTIATETTEKEDLPALVSPTAAVDVASKESEPEAGETDLLPVGEDLVEGTEEEFTDVPSADEGIEEEFTDVPSADEGIEEEFTDVPSADEGIEEEFTDVPSADEGTEEEFTDVPSAADEGTEEEFTDVPSAADEGIEEEFTDVPSADEGTEEEFTDVLSVNEGTEEEFTDVPSADEEVNPEQPAEDADINVMLTYPEEPVFEAGGMEEATESEGQAPPVEEEGPAAPEISTVDLTDDEILLVNMRPAQPTTLSPERESPFTHISDVAQTDITIPSLVEIQTANEGLDDATIGDQDYDVIHYGYGLINHTEEGSTSFPFGVAHGTDQVNIAMPVNPGRALMVFFSLRVTNMIFSDDLFNKSSPEYKALEQRFIELLVPYLQSNLSNFENLEILNFRNGSIVVNSRMKFGKPVPQTVTNTVYLILEDFCNTAYQTMNLAIDKYSLDVESGDKADPCKFQACNEYAECKVNKWSGEAECVCNAGYFSVDSLPCQSICELRSDFCLNDGKCDIIPGQGAICRCRVGENWWYRGEHCEEYVSEPLVVGIAIASVAGFLLVASGVIFFLARTLRDQYDKDEPEDPLRQAESIPSLERATKYNPMYESEATTGYSHYYRRYPEAPVYSSASAEASTEFSSEEIRHIYENSELTKEEIQDRIRIIELYAKDRQFADFVRHHQAVVDTRRESSSAHT
ncbi:interphotoreceptor matrix proteoglycan 2 [Sander lucioperca]|uniref:interphotoreceptor matrix proteoglycan 2 n=1 Tax=Sander lucioperca TaxID=283035 RepID=UPI0016539E61|nr:interphotoreceptor matrix proteoglycan 2 [Sander lucioperca]